MHRPSRSLIAVVVTAASLLAACRRSDKTSGGAAPSQTAPSSAAASAALPSAQRARAAIYSSAFDSGKLPAALPLPSGGVDQQAQALAADMAAGDAKSVPALVTA